MIIMTNHIEEDFEDTFDIVWFYFLNLISYEEENLKNLKQIWFYMYIYVFSLFLFSPPYLSLS